MTVGAPAIDDSFPHPWSAEILPTRPLILPPRHYIYPRQAEEVERGALEVLIKPEIPGAPVRDPHEQVFVRGVEDLDFQTWDRPFLATCALGFRDPIVPTGL